MSLSLRLISKFFLCFAELLRYYYLTSSESRGNDYTPKILQDDLIEHYHISENNYLKEIPLMSSNENLKRRKVPYVLKYHVPNKHTLPEEHAHHIIIFVFFIYR